MNHTRDIVMLKHKIGHDGSFDDGVDEILELGNIMSRKGLAFTIPYVYNFVRGAHWRSVARAGISAVSITYLHMEYTKYLFLLVLHKKDSGPHSEYCKELRVAGPAQVFPKDLGRVRQTSDAHARGPPWRCTHVVMEAEAVLGLDTREVMRMLCSQASHQTTCHPRPTRCHPRCSCTPHCSII